MSGALARGPVGDPEEVLPAMRRHTVTFFAVLLIALPGVGQDSLQDPIPWANKFFSGKPETPPPVILHDFGTLPKGTVRTYRFDMTNIYAFPVTIQKAPWVSCGCVNVVEYTGTMGPRETGHILVRIDTSKVTGPKQVPIQVRFDSTNPRTGERFFSYAKLEVRAVSQPDISIEPGAVEFGTVPAGRRATQAVNIVYSGRQPNWAITAGEYKKELLDVDVRRIDVRGPRSGYQVTTTLKDTAPAGGLNETIVLKTNDPTSPALTLTVTGSVQAPLTVFGLDKDGFLKLGKVEIGKTEKRIVTVQADKKFKVAKVEGQGDGVTAFVAPVDAKKSQSMTITFAPEKTGLVKKVLTIKTDTGDSVNMTVEALGVEPIP